MRFAFLQLHRDGVLACPCRHHTPYHHEIVAIAILINVGGDAAVVWEAELEHFIFDQKPRPTPTLLPASRTAPLFMQT